MHRMLPNNGHKATRDFSPFFYTRYSKSEHTAQLCHNLVTTLSQGCDSFNYKVVSSLSQGCHKVATRLLWQPCGNLVTTLSFLYGLEHISKYLVCIVVYFAL